MDGQLRTYTNPVLMVSGDRATPIPPSSAEATFRAFPDGGYFNVVRVGHSLQIEAPRRVRELLAALL